MADLLSGHLLSLIVFLPTTGALLLLLFPGSRPRAAIVFALCFSLLDAVLALPLWLRFDLVDKGFQFRETAPWIPSLGISYALGIVGFSLVLILLSVVMQTVSLLLCVHDTGKETSA